MTSTQQLKEIKSILNAVLAPTIRIEKDAEYPMTETERVQWLANEYREAMRELDSIAEDAAGEDL